jgi:hypothetical protein
MQQPSSDEQQITRRRDRIVQVLEDIFILQAANAGIKSAELRKIRGVAMRRITRITKQLGK